MGNTFQSVFHAILKCMINHICSFKGPDGRSAWSLSPSEVEDDWGEGLGAGPRGRRHWPAPSWVQS